MASMSNPVQQLLNAEKKASVLVNDARARKTQRVKQARAEVQEEISAYRQQCDDECKRQEDEIRTSFEEVQHKVDMSVEKEIAINQDSVSKNMDKALQTLLGAVCDVRCELHINYDVDDGKAKQRQPQQPQQPQQQQQLRKNK